MSESGYVRSPELLAAGSCRLLVVDMQERLLPHIPVAERTIANCRKLIRGAQILDVPISATEQYPKGLGATTPVLAELLGEMPEKLRFSCAEVLDLSAEDDERYQIVVCGIEAHVCVLQTVLDLVAAGLRVYVAADAVASRGKLDWQIALERMRDSGATVTTTESVLFEWCEVAGTEGFRGISALVKEDGGKAESGKRKAGG